MRCPHCESYQVNIIDSRDIKDGRRRRRYKCYDCGKRFTTYEYSTEMVDVDAIRKETRDNTFNEILTLIRERRNV